MNYKTPSASYNPTQVNPTTLRDMASPKHIIHVGVSAVALVIGAILSIAIGDPTVALIFSGAAFSGIGYWLGAAAQRRHG
jgi:hypothetical protein